MRQPRGAGITIACCAYPRPRSGCNTVLPGFVGIILHGNPWPPPEIL